MSEDIPFPGHCFGNYDKTTKECRWCKVKKGCSGKKPDRFSGSTGISQLMEKITLSQCHVLLKPDDETRISCLLPKGTISLKNDGKIEVNISGNVETYNHIASVEEADKIWNLCQ